MPGVGRGLATDGDWQPLSGSDSCGLEGGSSAAFLFFYARVCAALAARGGSALWRHGPDSELEDHMVFNFLKFKTLPIGERLQSLESDSEPE